MLQTLVFRASVVILAALVPVRALAQGTASVAGHVVARNGAPAAGVSLAVDLRPQGFDFAAVSSASAFGE